MRHPTDEQLVLYHYGELRRAESTAMDEHMVACDRCGTRLAALERELAALGAIEVPERPEDYGTRVWQRLQPRLATAREPVRSGWWQAAAPTSWFRPFAYAAGLAVLVVGAFLAGRLWPARPAPPAAVAGTAQPAEAARAAAPRQVRERILVLAVGDHLERSQAALLEVLNAPSGEGRVDLAGDRERARQLIAQNRLYRLTAVDAGEQGIASVLDELERALMEIANSPSHLSNTEFERVRAGIDAQGVVFKVRILGDTLRHRQVKGSSST